MKIVLVGARKQKLFFAILLVVAGGFAVEAAKVWMANCWAASPKSENWFRAAQLEPGNAEYWHHLGLFEQWDTEHDGLAQAIRYYEKSVAVNPRSDTYWMDLGEAYEMRGELSGAEQAYQKAKHDYPVSADVAWRYGSFLLRQNDTGRAFAELRNALRSNPKLETSAIAQCWKSGASVLQILGEVLPARSQDYLIALDFFLGQRQDAATLVVWGRLLDLKEPFEIQRAMPLVNDLIAHDRLNQAQRVWQQALMATRWPADGSANRSAVFNGGFEHDILNGGFDWQEIPIHGASFESDAEWAHSGARSLKIKFDGTDNLNFSQLLQWVLVEPRRSYRFAAYLRTEELSTDSGIRFLIRDPRNRSMPEILTPDLTGNHSWSLVEANLTTGPETHLLSIALRRLPSRKFDNKLQGTVWLDDVSLTAVNEPKTGIP